MTRGKSAGLGQDLFDLWSSPAGTALGGAVVGAAALPDARAVGAVSGGLGGYAAGAGARALRSAFPNSDAAAIAALVGHIAAPTVGGLAGVSVANSLIDAAAKRKHQTKEASMDAVMLAAMRDELTKIATQGHPAAPQEYEEMTAPKWKQTAKDLGVALAGSAIGYGVGKTTSEYVMPHLLSSPGAVENAKKFLPAAAAATGGLGTYLLSMQRDMMKKRRELAERDAQKAPAPVRVRSPDTIKMEEIQAAARARFGYPETAGLNGISTDKKGQTYAHIYDRASRRHRKLPVDPSHVQELRQQFGYKEAGARVPAVENAKKILPTAAAAKASYIVKYDWGGGPEEEERALTAGTDTLKHFQQQGKLTPAGEEALRMHLNRKHDRIHGDFVTPEAVNEMQQYFEQRMGWKKQAGARVPAVANATRKDPWRTDNRYPNFT